MEGPLPRLTFVSPSVNCELHTQGVAAGKHEIGTRVKGFATLPLGVDIRELNVFQQGAPAVAKWGGGGPKVTYLPLWTEAVPQGTPFPFSPYVNPCTRHLRSTGQGVCASLGCGCFPFTASVVARS